MAPIQGLKLFHSNIYRETLKKNHWPEYTDRYIAWRLKFVQIKSLGSCIAHPRGLNFYTVIYREMLKNLLLKNHLANFNQTW